MAKKAFAIIGVFIIMLFAIVAEAAVCPNLVSLGELRYGSEFRPVRIATDSKGNIYASDNFSDKVIIYDYKGNIIKAKELEGPLGIDVDDAGRMYIGRAEGIRGYFDGDVVVYDQNFNALYSLGKGWGEFDYPVGVIEEDGLVYVSDSRTDMIKIYDANTGTLVRSFGGYGTADGNLVVPNEAIPYNVTLTLKIEKDSMPFGRVAESYSATLYATGGPVPYNWSIISGALPDGFLLDGQSGAITGTPTTSGTFNFTAQVTDANSATASKALSIYIEPVPAPDTRGDNFDDGVMGPQWELWNVGNNYTSEANGALIINTPPAVAAGDLSGWKQTAPLSGDFDFQVDFSNLAVTAGGASTGNAQLIFTDTGGTFVYMDIRKSADGSVFKYRAYAGGAFTDVATTATSGKLRVQRQGTTANLYYWNGSDWTVARTYSPCTALDGTIALRVYAAAAGVSTMVNFDNFKDNLYISPSQLPTDTPPPAQPVAERIYVIDRALQYSTGDDGLGTTPGWGLGANGHIFTQDGNFIKRFGGYGYSNAGLGMMIVPGTIIIDKQQRILVSDYSTGDINVFDIEGNSICDIMLTTYTANPMGMALGNDGRLFIGVNGMIYVKGLDDYVGLSVSPTNITYNAGQCSSGQVNESINLTNMGPGVLSWNITSDSPWIIPSLTSGEINGQGTANVGIGINLSGLAPGSHTGTVTVKAQGAEEKVAVAVNIPQPVDLSVSPSALSFDIMGTTMPPAGTLNVNASGEGVLSWTASVDVPWLSVSPSSGTTDTSYIDNVIINSAGLQGLSSGTYMGAIAISSACAAGGPITVPVTLNYVTGGTIQVNTDYQNASFTISGPQTYSGSGLAFTVDNAPEGIYTIAFAKAQGMIEPDSYSLPVVNGQATIFTGNYKTINGVIITTFGEASWNVDDEVRVFDESGAMIASFIVSPANPAIYGLREGSETATGDFDGDGQEDILVAHDNGVITGYRPDGTPIDGLNFMAFSYSSDVVVAGGDFDGDGKDEIIAGSGNKSGIQGYVRIFTFTNGVIYDTGVNFLAFQKKKGVNVASGDIDGDGIDELITTTGGSGRMTAEMRFFEINTAAGIGGWTAVDSGNYQVGTTIAGTSVSTGDLDGDATDEVMVAIYNNNGSYAANIYIYNGNGTLRTTYAATSVTGKVNIAAGDLDMDGHAEITVSEGDVTGTPPAIRIYNPDGSFRTKITVFDNPEIGGAKVSLGRMTGQ